MPTLLERTFFLVDHCEHSNRDLAELAGVNRHWLEKFRQRKYPNPRINAVQKLHDYLAQGDWSTSEVDAFVALDRHAHSRDKQEAGYE